MTPSEPDETPALILVVDDNATSRYIIGNWLGRAGHTVIEAVDGTHALAVLGTPAAEPLELAIVDVRLPDMSGFEVCERIKAAPATAGVPVIHVSATAIATADRAQGLHRGADAYLTEPIAPTELLATVATALRYARARRRAELQAERLSTLNRATLEVYGSADELTLAAAVARGASSLLRTEVAVLTESNGSGSVLVTTTGPGHDPSTAKVASEDLAERLSGRLAELFPADRVGVATCVMPGEEWADLSTGGALSGDVVLVLARVKRGRPAVGIAMGAVHAQDPEDRALTAQLAQSCALVLETLRDA